MRKYSIKLEKKELEEWKDLASKLNLKTVSSLIRQSILAVKLDPDLLIHQKPKTDMDEALRIYIHTLAEYRTEQRKREGNLEDRLNTIEQQLDTLAKHLKVPKKALEKTIKDRSGGAIFDE